MKKVLILASVASMIRQFNMNNISLLQQLGFEVHVACNFIEGNTCDISEVRKLKAELEKEKIPYFQIDFSRSVKSISRNYRAFQQVRKLLKKNQYYFIHCHSPIGGLIGRIAGRENHIKVMYTAHGFHFYKGAPIFNWCVYFPIEWLCSWFTDQMITINKEDYLISKRHMHAKKNDFVPGVGINIDDYKDKIEPENKEKIRKKLNIEEKELVFLSVGELNKNKNHKTIICALQELPEINFKYFICGEGILHSYLEKIIVEKHLENKVFLLGFREDIRNIYQIADVFLFPSKREGLSVALMEAMASGLPVICSKIRGNVDLVDDKREGYLVKRPTDSAQFANAIKDMIENNKRYKMGQAGRKKIEEFSKVEVEKKMKQLYAHM